MAQLEGLWETYKGRLRDRNSKWLIKTKIFVKWPVQKQCAAASLQLSWKVREIYPQLSDFNITDFNWTFIKFLHESKWTSTFWKHSWMEICLYRQRVLFYWASLSTYSMVKVSCQIFHLRLQIRQQWGLPVAKARRGGWTSQKSNFLLSVTSVSECWGQPGSTSKFRRLAEISKIQSLKSHEETSGKCEVIGRFWLYELCGFIPKNLEYAGIMTTASMRIYTYFLI